MRSVQSALVPPGPQGGSLFGLSRDLRKNPLLFLSTLGRLYGDAVRFRFFANFYGYLFFHPEHNKHILQDNHRNYSKEHPSFILLRPLIGNGLLTNDGEDWLRQRRLIQPAFHGRRIAELGPVMTGSTEDMLEDWAARGDEPFDLAEAFMRLTLRIVIRSLFSIDIAGSADPGNGTGLRDAAGVVREEFSYANHHIAEISSMPFGDFYLRLPFPRNIRFRRAVRALDEVVYTIIEERRRAQEGGSRAGESGRGGNDLLSMLMEAVDEASGSGMDDRQLRDEVMTLMLAGHETTSVLLSWTFHLLSSHPNAEAQLRAELESQLHGRTPTMRDLPGLVYTRMVLDEVLRLYPPAYAIGRLSLEPDEVGGYALPARSVVTLSPYLTHRHPDFWEEPEKFDPERFRPERAAGRPRHAFIPFGSGPRQCIGNSFAMTEAQLILATILQRCRLRPVPGHPVEPEPLITLRPKYGLPMTAQID